MAPDNTELTISEGDGKLVTHDNGDVTIVPAHTSDADAAELAKLTGDDVAQGLADQKATQVEAAPADEKPDGESDQGQSSAGPAFTG